MKRSLFCICLITMLGFCSNILAQKSAKAKEILDKAVATIKKANGISATFTGTQEGIILLKEDKFYIKSAGVESWFDGKTQWSYVKDNEEVNISNPSPEELQNINPYALLSLYKQGYDYLYAGAKNRDGKSGHEIVLKPVHSTNVVSITLFITNDNFPSYLKIEVINQPPQEITIKSYKINQQFTDSIFKFEQKKYPHAEIIDLR